LDPHGKSCPHYEEPVKLTQKKRSNKDKKAAFSDAWPGRWEPYETEYRFHPVRKWRFDFAWPKHLVAVEVDGNAWHVKGGGGHMQDTDLEKLNAAAELNWTVFRYSPGMLKRDPDLVNQVHNYLVRTGAR
jgi:hypothetical protein